MLLNTQTRRNYKEEAAITGHTHTAVIKVTIKSKIMEMSTITAVVITVYINGVMVIIITLTEGEEKLKTTYLSDECGWPMTVGGAAGRAGALGHAPHSTQSSSDTNTSTLIRPTLPRSLNTNKGKQRRGSNYT